MAKASDAARARNAKAKRRSANRRKAAAGTAANVRAAHRRPRCSICLKNMTDRSTLRTICGHVFHRKCFYRWLKYRLFCPICDRNFLTEYNAGGNAVPDPL